MHRLAPVFVFLLISLATLAPTFAADFTTKELELGTRAEFRACLESEENMKNLRSRYDEHAAASRERMLQVQKSAAALIDEQKILDYTDQKQIDAFNKRSEQHNKLVAAANEEVRKLSAEQNFFNEASLLYNRKCAALMVSNADREAVLQERKLAAAQAASPAQAPADSGATADGKTLP